MKITDLLSGKEYFYLMHLSWGYNSRRRELWDFARQKRIIGLDHREVTSDWPAVRDNVKKKLSGTWINQFDMLCENMSLESMDNGDIVVVMAGWDHVLGIGRVIGPHRYNIAYRDLETFFDHVRPVEWIIEYDYENQKKIPRVYFDRTLLRIDRSNKRWPLFLSLDFISEKTHPPSQPSGPDSENLKQLAAIQTELTKETTLVNRYRRSRELVERLKQLYGYQCQLCSLKFIHIPQIPMKDGRNYVEVHHIKGFNEVSDIGNTNQEEGNYEIDNFKNAITVCVYHHKLLHKHKSEFSYDASQKCFISKDKSIKLPLVLNKHL